MHVQHYVDSFIRRWTSGLFPSPNTCIGRAAVHIAVQVFMWAPDFDSVGYVSRWRKGWIIWKLCSAPQEVGGLFTQWLYHPGSHQPCGRVPVSPHPCQHLLLSLFFRFFSTNSVLGVRQPFTVADSISLMSNDSEQSPVVLVFSFSLDPVLFLFPSPHTLLQTSSQPLGGSPGSLGRQPELGIPLLATGTAPWFLSGSSGWDWSSTATLASLQSLLHPTGSRS